MPSLIDLSALATVGTALLAGGSAVHRMLSARTRPPAPHEPHPLRRYTLLRTTDAYGAALCHETTRPPGTVIVRQVNGHPQHFELTNTAVGDGTYAAEPLDGL